MVRFKVFLILLLFSSVASVAQDTLPNFSATTRGNKRVIIGWTNPFPVVKQISIQRSLDSLRNYKTILTVPDPTVLQNGFVDTKAQTDFMFYRLFIVLDSGKYVFSKPRRPVLDKSTGPEGGVRPGGPVNGSRQVVVSPDMSRQEVDQLKEKLGDAAAAPSVEKSFTVMRRDSVIRSLTEKQFQPFRDSIVRRTKDTLVFLSVDTIQVKVFVPKVIYKPSTYVFTEADGNVAIVLPRALQRKYSVLFFEDNNDPLFEIKQVKETHLSLDKANFLHAGWFRFELYEDGKLLEKHRFYIPRDF